MFPQTYVRVAVCVDGEQAQVYSVLADNADDFAAERRLHYLLGRYVRSVRINSGIRDEFECGYIAITS